MATPLPFSGRGTFSEIVRKGVLLSSALAFGLLLPALVTLGGSTNLINWGPGLLLAGASGLLLLDKDRRAMRGGGFYSACLLGLLGLLFVRAGYSPDVSATANNSALIALAAIGYLIGKLAGMTKSHALFIGLSLVSMLNLSCTVMQLSDPEWNLIYPHRTGGFPSGLFAHYSYSAAFCLGTAGLLVSRSCGERVWMKSLLIGGAICALVTIPLSLSRGGNLALAFLVATACALLLARAFRNSKSMVSTWLPALVLLLLILIFGSLLVPMIGRNAGTEGFYGDSVRIDFWKAAIQISMNHPWIGDGAGSFAWEVFHVMDGLTTEPGMTHNEALQVVVDYGYPALVALAALIAVPVGISFWRFVNKSAGANASWAAIGLLAMLVQSNFESIFHTGPVAFIAALILGHISRNLWNAETNDALKNSDRKTDDTLDRGFLRTVKAHVDDYSAGSGEAVSKLVALLSQSKSESWIQEAYLLAYWKKVNNKDALHQSMKDLGRKCREELARLSSNGHSPTKGRGAARRTRSWHIFGNLALAGCAGSIVLSGAGLTQALIDAWVPVYHSDRLSISKRFPLLLNLVENHPGLGLDRKVLAAGMDCIYEYESPEAREHWASAYRARILRAIPGWRTDPGTALQLAEIIGWASDVESSLAFYDHAITTQGNNEALFLAHAFKGQYLYELCISAAAEGQENQKKFYAQQAIATFQNADAAMRMNRGTLSPFFMKMLRDCESMQKLDM